MPRTRANGSIRRPAVVVVTLRSAATASNLRSRAESVTKLKDKRAHDIEMSQRGLRRRGGATEAHASITVFSANQLLGNIFEVRTNPDVQGNLLRVDEVPRRPPQMLSQVQNGGLLLVDVNLDILILNQHPDDVGLQMSRALHRVAVHSVNSVEDYEVAILLSVNRALVVADGDVARGAKLLFELPDC